MSVNQHTQGLPVFVKSYGLFWDRDEVVWEPGTGGTFRVLGRRGMRYPGLCVADFRFQQGIYILYGKHGAYYVGLTKSSLGKRLKDHTTDDHRFSWDRFSWFGFCSVMKGKDEYGLCKLKQIAEKTVGSPKAVITDVEALLIRAMGLSNINQMKFAKATEWTQIEKHEAMDYLDKL